jgi:cyclophilin family peptidyl-prolyl cis-trans isomerase
MDRTLLQTLSRLTRYIESTAVNDVHQAIDDSRNAPLAISNIIPDSSDEEYAASVLTQLQEAYAARDRNERQFIINIKKNANMANVHWVFEALVYSENHAARKATVSIRHDTVDHYENIDFTAGFGEGKKMRVKALLEPGILKYRIYTCPRGEL